jgi:hyaluronan synthase
MDSNNDNRYLEISDASVACSDSSDNNNLNNTDGFNYCNKRSVFLSILLSSLLIVPIVVGYHYKWMNNIKIDDIDIYVTIFGYCTLVHFIGQLILSYLNYRNDKKIKDTELRGNLPSVSIQITGWKEDPELFEKCLISIKKQDYQNIKHITFCSDGNDDDDKYLLDVFIKVFGEDDTYLVDLEQHINCFTKEEQCEIFKNSETKKNICFFQPHKGKRDAMYAQLLHNIYHNCDYILLVDSDTVFSKSSLTEMVKGAIYYDCDAITGNVGIYNQDNILSYLVALRYWFAFNIERSSQSYFGTVSCVSGPIGLYKTSMIEKIVNCWVKQTFFNKACTFGDDRHLTNLVFKENGTIYFTSNAICYTDTPITLTRYISQQTRWSKSFFREFLLNLSWFKIKQWWLIFDLSFMLFYPLFLIVFSVILFTKFDILVFLTLIMLIMVISYIRSIYAIILTGDIDYLVFNIYGFMYFLFVLPLKLWAMFTVNLTNWGTGNRMQKTFKNMDLIPVLIWNALIITSLGININKEVNNKKNKQLNIILSSIIGANFVFSMIIYYLLRNRMKKNINKIIDKIINE